MPCVALYPALSAQSLAQSINVRSLCRDLAAMSLGEAEANCRHPGHFDRDEQATNCCIGLQRIPRRSASALRLSYRAEHPHARRRNMDTLVSMRGRPHCVQRRSRKRGNELAQAYTYPRERKAPVRLPPFPPASDRPHRRPQLIVDEALTGHHKARPTAPNNFANCGRLALPRRRALSGAPTRATASSRSCCPRCAATCARCVCVWGRGRRGRGRRTWFSGSRARCALTVKGQPGRTV